MEEWKEVEAVWQEGLVFSGENHKGDGLVMSGSGNGFSPMELLLLGLAGCTGVDVASILQKKRQNFSKLIVKVRGLRRNEIPRIFTDIKVEYIVISDSIDPKAVEQAIRLSEEKYCSASIMLGQSAVIHSSYNICKSLENS